MGERDENSQEQALIADRLLLTPEQRLLENEALARAIIELRRSAGVRDDRFDPPE